MPDVLLKSDVSELDDVLGDRAIRASYQPIAELETGRTVAYEALARGPAGSTLERPDRLFAAARASGRLAEVDWACPSRPCEGPWRPG